MKWTCGICGYDHDDEEPPQSCPVCGAPKSKFSEYAPGGENGVDDPSLEDDDVDDFERDLYGDEYEQ